jgi:hypothetical protein
MAITFEQLTSDFWKEKMILLQRQNSRTNCALSNLEQAKKKLLSFRQIFRH